MAFSMAARSEAFSASLFVRACLGEALREILVSRRQVPEAFDIRDALASFPVFRGVDPGEVRKQLGEDLQALAFDACGKGGVVFHAPRV